MRHGWTMLVAVLGILEACGSEPTAPVNSNRLVVTVTGRVRSALNAAPIPGASLKLYRVINYSEMITLDRDTTDADGRYRLSSTYSGDYYCDEPGINVGASGYYGHFSALVQVQCIEDPQIRDIYLDPEPVRLIVSPETLTLRPGDRQRFTVSATFADGTSGPPPPYGPWPGFGNNWEVAWRVAGDSTCGWLVGPKTGESVEYVAPATALTTLCGTATVGQVLIVAAVIIWGAYEPLSDSALVTISP